ncbi:hypothetical protein PIB30_095061 [Stylosanthes scabra]|uniref:Uncharacterized protein n=1 Tax=Stylosanthes scabra TaxID=79078 RepID=A0ABU6RVK8_9FABA|nr:hypothetical protein [Stylosanthes scabra]
MQGVEVRGEEGIGGETGASAVSMGHFVEHLAGMAVHVGFPIWCDDAGAEALLVDLRVLLLVVEDVVDTTEPLGGGEVANNIFVYAGVGAESFKVRGLLELLHEEHDVRFSEAGC